MGGDSDVTVRTGLSVWNRVVAIRFGLAAFLIPLAIRSIPEIIVGPYPVGWDTIEFYIPSMLDWDDRNRHIHLRALICHGP